MYRIDIGTYTASEFKKLPRHFCFSIQKHLFMCYFDKIVINMRWRDGSVIRNICCSSRGLKLGSQYSHLPEFLDHGISHALLAFGDTCKHMIHVYTYTYTGIHIHKHICNKNEVSAYIL